MDITPVNDAPEAVIAPAIDTPVFRIGDEILVNSATANGQFEPRIAKLENGGFVVTWYDYSQGDGGAAGDTSDSAVKAQVFAADGTPLDAEILVNTATEGYQYNQGITSLSNGGFVVAWVDQSPGVGGTPSDFAIKAQVFAADGTPVDAEILVESAAWRNHYEPEITSLSNGGFVIAWQDEQSAVKAQVFDAGGAAVGNEILVDTAIGSYQIRPEITALENGGFVVTWLDEQSAVKAQVFGADGAQVGTELLVDAATGSSQISPEITALSNGGFVVTWQDQSDIKAQVFSADGTPVGSEILVNTATDNSQSSPEITALSTGGFVVTWQDYSQGVGGAIGDTSSAAVKAQVFAEDGTPLGSEILVNTATEGGQTEPEITALSNGGFVVTWRDNSQGVGGATGDTSIGAVKAQVFGPDGKAVGTELLVNTATEGYQYDPKITALPNGSFVVTWVDESRGVGGNTGDTSSTAIKAQVYGYGAVEQTDFVLKGIGLSVSDVDANGGIETITLAVDEGTLTAAVGDSGVTIVSGNGTGSVEISGTIAQLNALLGIGGTSTLVYFNDSDTPSPSTTLSLTIDDGGNT
ncbi:MAG: hypothetical protein ABJP39_05045, partial [Marinobacter alexandrii]|uniref:hypothetical protein n=1 Tax=Marinobacter alexandrii TaxID=2570351 RepID=UPI003297F689